MVFIYLGMAPEGQRMSRMAHNARRQDLEADDETIADVSARNGLTDTYGSDRFIAKYGRDWRFDHDRGLWLTFRETEQRWRQATPGEVEELAIERGQDFMREIETADFDSDKIEERAKAWGKYCQQRRGIENILAVTKNRPPIAVTSKEWNRDSWLVGVPNGIVDLRKGKLLRASREHLISLSLGVPYNPTAECLRWEQFLQEVFEGDALLIAYVQRVLGYALTGSTQEQVWWLLHGEGSNGKSVFLNVVAYVFGEYGKTASFSMFERKQRPQVGDGTEMLVGVRFVTARETIEGTRLDEARMKALTGSDPVATRPLYDHTFEFDPKFKLFLCANHKPVVTDNSHAFWRRVHLVPFPHVFVKGSPGHDEKLEEKLKAEGPGILAWMVKGCLKWQTLGYLRPPMAVTKATSEYEKESDQLGRFINECCDVARGATCGAGALFRRYERWAGEQGIPESERLNVTTFGNRMKQKFDRDENSRGRFYRGLQLKTE
jgi:putative DNA primase/helicase